MKKESGSAGEEKTGEEVIWVRRREKGEKKQREREEVFLFFWLNRERERSGKMNKEME